MGPGWGWGHGLCPLPTAQEHFKVGAQLVKDLCLYLGFFFFFFCSKLDILL